MPPSSLLNDKSPSRVMLENGQVFLGYSPSWQKGIFAGEVVFTTGMTGYPETLTDPSYAGQLLVFTYPLIGNYGIPSLERWESTKIQASGVIINEACHYWSHHTGMHSFMEWLKIQNIPLIFGVDTRALTKTLRKEGTMRGAITSEDPFSLSFSTDPQEHLVSKVSPLQKTQYRYGEKIVIAVDCGMKENMIRSLSKFNITIFRVPHNYDYTRDEYDGIFLSNGPGDPSLCSETLVILKKSLQQKKPIFGVCLGVQLMALASGAKTYKLKYGHRGHNQPCIDLESKRCYITSQNHGFAIDQHSLSHDWKVTFKNLNDHSVEGISHNSKPFFGVQFHPEASPGPKDTLWLFEKFYQML